PLRRLLRGLFLGLAVLAFAARSLRAHVHVSGRALLLVLHLRTFRQADDARRGGALGAPDLLVLGQPGLPLAILVLLRSVRRHDRWHHRWHERRAAADAADAGARSALALLGAGPVRPSLAAEPAGAARVAADAALSTGTAAPGGATGTGGDLLAVPTAERVAQGVGDVRRVARAVVPAGPGGDIRRTVAAAAEQVLEWPVVEDTDAELVSPVVGQAGQIGDVRRTGAVGA